MSRFRLHAASIASVGIALGLYAQTSGKVSFENDVAPIFERHCVACHGPTLAAGNLVVTSRAALLEGRAVVPGYPDSSTLYTLSILASDAPRAMPPGGPSLPDDQLDVLKRWIEQGAEWPEDVTLSGLEPGPEAGVELDEHETVRRIHARIQAHQRERADAPTGAYTVTVPNSAVSYHMIPIPAGEFVMGSSESDRQRKPDEQPAHKVKVQAFWMQSHEVTWDEYRMFMFSNQANEDANPDQLVDGVSRPTRPYIEMSFGMGIDGYPAISMTQHAANKYAQWLSVKTGEFYRLPTEAEWEYACRAGAATPYSFGAGTSELGEYAWYADNSGGKYQQVAQKRSNAWGLFDMSGNVREWTLDQYVPYQAREADNPWAKATAPYPHAVRGGSWKDAAEELRCAARVASDPSWKRQDPQFPKSIWYHTDAQWLGFRLVRPAKLPTPEEMYNYWNSGVEEEY